ncbi:L-lysine 6-monooxygenase (NADPH) [Plesiocystis pacifica SIR-1]|uniref:L-lysine 6-monooxygenase (NADPH) n=1 Tax=Plesiocystis pacifica SIR-1 TaxID=391625 RepID=A6G0Y8_9BACT|nr:SidA/IucD/PvdA family monooxygenase [Plesiocystis pacifica]EDM80526.1 L-lysine 6-monooxygenase (NADPH) [Plesiocystis pacifica SIR-1]
MTRHANAPIPRAPLPARPVDLLAVGCGPFNMGLAALSSTVPELKAFTVDAAEDFRWHPGLMFEDARLQVSFLADLVSLVDPTHPLSFLAYLADQDRMYPFYIRERFHMMRSEYEDYLRWALAQLEQVAFGQRVELVEWDAAAEQFMVRLRATDGGTASLPARNLSVGIGTAPWVPELVEGVERSRWMHSAQYLARVDEVDAAQTVTVVGSGQSGAEVVLDLLRRRPGPRPGIRWLTRTASFAPLDYTKLVLEMTTPSYVKHFHALPEATRDALVANQWRHYKGISTDTLEAIHDQLYSRAVAFGEVDLELRVATELRGVQRSDAGVTLRCHDRVADHGFERDTDLLIFATGYRHRQPTFLEPLEPLLQRDAAGRLDLDLDHAVRSDPSLGGKVFVVNADLHSHGVAAPDLGICAYRNARIINTVLGRAHYRLPERTAFTRFGHHLDHEGARGAEAESRITKRESAA